LSESNVDFLNKHSDRALREKLREVLAKRSGQKAKVEINRMVDSYRNGGSKNHLISYLGGIKN
jgi:hypothetical protein